MQPDLAFPDDEPDTQPDLAPLSRGSDVPPESACRARPPTRSSMYSIVPGRGAYESGVAPTEVVAPPPPRVPTFDDEARFWRVDVMLDRVGRGTHYELLEVGEDADWHTINRRYHALVNEFRANRYVTNVEVLQKKLACLMTALAVAYEALSTAERRRAYDARLREARLRGEIGLRERVKRR